MKIGITGTTGFVGSAIACQLLKDGVDVVAFSRNDPDGTRSMRSVEAAWKGFGFGKEPFPVTRIQVQNIDFRHPEDLPSDSLRYLEAFWHVAADMTYSSKRFVRSFQQNITNTSALHNEIETRAPNCKRFYYISTAYTGGFKNTNSINESIHDAPQVDNVYQATKWMAETTLGRLGEKGSLSVSIVRPSIVVGHSENGWRGESNFGLYGFARAAAHCFSKRIDSLRFDLDPMAELNLIPIDILAVWSSQLTKRSQIKEGTEVFNATAQSSLTVGDVTDSMSQILGIDVSCGKPKRAFDKIVQKHTNLNAPFARQTWLFSNKSLISSLGDDWRSFHMTKQTVNIILARYFSEAIKDLERENTGNQLVPIDNLITASVVAAESIGVQISRRKGGGIGLEIPAIPKDLRKLSKNAASAGFRFAGQIIKRGAQQ